MSSPDPSVLDDVPPRHPASELQEALLAAADIEAFLQQITDVARDGHPITVASSDGYAARLDEVQYERDEGPCRTAMRAGKNVLIDDLLTEERFPSYRPALSPSGCDRRCRSRSRVASTPWGRSTCAPVARARSDRSSRKRRRVSPTRHPAP